jgi:hypothetical protein
MSKSRKLFWLYMGFALICAMLFGTLMILVDSSSNFITNVNTYLALFALVTVAEMKFGDE